MRLDLGSAASLLGLAVVLGSCSSEVTARTQLVVRTYIELDVRQRAETLYIRTRSGKTPNAPEGMREVSFGKDDVARRLVDVVLVPSDNKDDQVVDILVQARDVMGGVIAEQRALTSFAPEQRSIVELTLTRCGLMPLGEVCKQTTEECFGTSCISCSVELGCAPVAATEPKPYGGSVVRAEVELDGGPEVRDGGDGGDAGDAYVGDADPRDVPVDAGDGGRPDGGDADASDGKVDAPVVVDPPILIPPVVVPPVVVPPVIPDPPVVVPACNEAPVWRPALAGASVPASVEPPHAIKVTNGDVEEDRAQYVCHTTKDQLVIPGKANTVVGGASFDFGCYYAYLPSGETVWQSEPKNAADQVFEVLAPPVNTLCRFVWQLVTAGSALPANAVVTGKDASGAPLYSCQVFKQDHQKSVGNHNGRVSGVAGDSCQVQWFGGVEASTSFTVLVQEPKPK